MRIVIGFKQTVNVGNFESISPSVEMEFNDNTIEGPADPRFREWYDKCEQIVKAYYHKEFNIHTAEVVRRRSSSYYDDLPPKPQANE